MNKSRAFTLIELMVVVAIIAFLASVAVPRYTKYFLKAKETEVSMVLSSLQTAEQLYILENGTYTNNLKELDWKPEGEFYYTYGFYFSGAKEGINYFVGKLKAPPQHLGNSHADKKTFIAKAAGDKNVWQIDESRKIRKECLDAQ